MADATAVAPAPQHMTALAQANRVRLARAHLKHEVRDGSKAATQVIAEVPWEAESMTISDLLMSQHRWGRTRTRRFLASIPMLETKTIGSMTDRQRKALVLQLDGEPTEEMRVRLQSIAAIGQEPVVVTPRPAPPVKPLPYLANGVVAYDPSDYLQHPIQ